ncbi:MAG: hypothetical protein RRY07_00770 [Bacteroidaceae bacterium]
MSICAFTTESWTDTRKAAQQMLETYLAAGTVSQWECLEKQLKGQKAIMLMGSTFGTAPVAGQNFLLIQNEGKLSETYQYVRVIKVTAEQRTFYRSNGGNTEAFKLNVYTCEITDPLEFEFSGWTPQEFISGGISTRDGFVRVRETRIADAARYYSAKKLTQPALKGSATLHVESIFTNLVPSTQSESPMADLGVSGAYTGILKGSQLISYSQFLTVGSGRSTSTFSTAIAPDTLSILLNNGDTIRDNGNNQLFKGSIQVGTIQYDQGIVTWLTSVFAYDGDVTVSFSSATPSAQSDQSDYDKVTESNKGKVWVKTLNPIPAKGSVRVTYVSGTKHYTMYDNGDGSLGGTTSGVGVGSVNYDTGTLTLSLSVFPDVGSYILYQWGDKLVSQDTITAQDPNIYVELDTANMVSLFDGVYKLANNPTLSWVVKNASNENIAKTAVLNKSTMVLSGDATGTITKDRAAISPSVPIPVGTPVTLSFTSTTGGDSYTRNTPVSDTAGKVTIDLSAISEEIDPYSINFDLPITLEDTVYDFVAAWEAQATRTTLNNLQLYVSGWDSSAGVYAVSMRKNGHVPAQRLGAYNATTKKIEIIPTVNFNMLRKVTKRGDGYYGDYYTTEKWESVPHSISEYSSVPASVSTRFTNMTTPPTTTTQNVNVKGYSVAAKAVDGYILNPANVSFIFGGKQLRLNGLGQVVHAPLNGASTIVGTYSGDVSLALNVLITDVSLNYANTSAVTWVSAGVVAKDTPRQKFAFYIPLSPVRNGSFAVRLKTAQGLVELEADADGYMSDSQSRISGFIDYQLGFVTINFWDVATNLTLSQAQSRFSTHPYLGNDVTQYQGFTSLGGSLYRLQLPNWMYASDVTYNAVGLVYMPLSKKMLGIDPVRLPADGRVPCFRPSDMVVITEDKTVPVSNPVAGGTVSLGETRISTLVIKDFANTVVTDYVANMSSGVVLFDQDFNSANYVLPLRVEFSVQDLVLLQDVQVNGVLALNKVLAHDYSAGCLVSSVVFIGDMKARAYNKFHQASWNNIWSDERQGQTISANYNTVFYPIVMSNDGAIKERWSLIFTSATTFRCIGEFVGELQGGSTTEDYAPINPNTQKPFFIIKKEGWGLGWVNGYVMRFNTDSANYPIWVVRTILQGQSNDLRQSFSMQLRGDIDNVTP